MKKLQGLKYVMLVLLIVPAICFVYYSFVPQYAIRDHEGYLGGAIILAGYIAGILIGNIIKEFIITKTDNGERYIYIVSILNVLMTLLCIKSLLYYYSRVYLISLVIFIVCPFGYIILRQLIIKNSKMIGMNYIMALCVSAIIALLSTVVRGMYLFRWQVLMTIISVIIGCIVYCDNLYRMNNDTAPYISFFPYDFKSWKNELKREFVDKFKVSAVIVLSLVTLYFFLGPLEIYVGNMLSFSFGYKTFLPIFITIGMVTLVFAPLVISLFTRKTYKIICVVLMTYSFLSYVQCMLMNTKLSEEDGARLRLDTMGGYPTINLLCWIFISLVIIIALYATKDKWTSVAMCVSAFISAVQMVAVVSLIITCMNSPAPRYYQLTGDKMFSVAKDNNVIVLVPDSFSRGFLNDVLADTPETMDIFKDFTYYDNVDSLYHPTFPSFTHFITGHEREDSDIVMSSSSEGRVEWLSEAWSDSKCIDFVNGIKDAGYHLYINVPQACELLGAYDDVYDKVENAEYAESNVDLVELTKLLFSMSIYRCVPYVVKPPFEYFSWDFAALERYNGKVAAYKNEDFYNEAKAGITVDDTIDNKVHIINWHGFHEEYTNDEFCNYVPNAEENGVTRLQNSKGAILCVKTYLDSLKAINRYDDSTIVVMGDHGKLYDGVVMIKKPNETHDKTIINSTSYTYCGFQGTILNIINAANKDNFEEKW